MKIDLSGEITFKDSELELANNINYIYGQNGAGKSTIAKLIVAQNLDKDVRVFNGFEGLLGDNHRLNAVVLGEENKRIDAQIEVKKNEIQILEEEKRKINATILKPADGSDNLWIEWSVKSRIVKDLEKTVEDFYSSAAAKIRNRSNPQVAAPSYDKRNFKADVARASLLDAEQIKKYESIMKSTVKTAVAIKFPEYDFAYLLNSVNAILEKKVEEKDRIDRLNTQEKKNFADTGRRIHVKGDLCAFCGNLIKDSVFDELEKFFSADEVKALQGEIKSLKTKLETASLKIGSCVINKDSFYDIYAERLGKLENDYTIIREGQVNYINTLISALCKKEASLFETTDKLSLELPETFENVEKEYESLAAENSANTLSIQQNEAKEKLRLHYVKMELDIFKYDVKNQEIVDAKKVELDTKSKIDVENEKIVGTGGIDEKISKLGKEISDLIKETKNGKKLAENINFKLKSMVSFELIPKGALEDLSEYCDRSFDLVMSFDSPISYTYPDQERTISELVRLAKKCIMISVSGRLGALPYLANPIQKNQFILDRDSNDGWVQWCISNREKMIEEFSFNKDTLWKSYKSGLLCDVEETKKAYENGEVPWSISYHFMPDELERILEKNGVKNISLAGPGAFARTIPNEILVKIMRDPLQRKDFLDFCYEYDNNPYVCGMGKDNLFAKGFIE